MSNARSTGVGEWTLLRGYIDAAINEGPAKAPTWELEEETGLVGDFDAFSIHGANAHPPREGKLVVLIQYVVDCEATSGELAAGSGASNVQISRLPGPINSTSGSGPSTRSGSRRSQPEKGRRNRRRYRPNEMPSSNFE